eukprot:s857_g7.t1
MRVLPGRLMSILDVEASKRRGSGPDLLGSARSNCSNGSRTMSRGYDLARGSLVSRPLDSARSVTSMCSRESENEELVAFDLLHTEKGFQTFKQWYLRQLMNSAEGRTQRSGETGLFPQAYCPAQAINEFAFQDYLQLFLQCSEAEALDFFGLLDGRMLGALTFQQIYLATLLIAAMSSRQLTRCLYMHSKWLFETLTGQSSHGHRVTWSRVKTLMQLLGASWYHISSSCPGASEFIPSSKLSHEEFVEVLFAVLAPLDRGSLGQQPDTQVVRPLSKVPVQKSRACVLL